MKRVFCFVLVTFFLAVVGDGALAAQSTKDSPVSVAEKQRVLQKIRVDKNVAPLEDEYVIGYGDLLAVSIYDEGDMSVNTLGSDKIAGGQGRSPNSILVRSDGRISLRDIGDVEAAGLTLPQLADYLKQLYSAIYDDPVLVTSLVKSNSRRYTVVGEIVRPGTYQLENPMNIVQVVAEAGGFTKWAGKKITVVRENLKRGDEQIFDGHKLEFDYDDFVSGKKLDKNISILSGDILFVK